MQQIITAKLKLIATSEQQQLLQQTQLAYSDAVNYVIRFAFEHGKISSERRIHKETYYDVRAQSKLPSEMTNNVIRQVAATYKGLWTKFKENNEHRRIGYTKKRYKGLEAVTKYVSPTVTYNYRLDYSFKPGQRVSILTLQGRVIVSYQGYNRQVTLIQNGATIRAAKLWYDKPHKQFYLLVSLEIEVADLTPDVQQTVVGVDVGMRYLATSTTMSNTSQFYPGKRVRARADHYTRIRKRLQKKGTRSATRRMMAMKGRERRLKLQVNHSIAKSIVQAHPYTLIGLEELTGIRERTKRRRKRHKKHGNGFEPVSQKARRCNRHVSKWAFAELQEMIAYKAILSGSRVIKVDADYTLHADLIGARNIAMRTHLIRQDWVRTGVLSVRPDVSSDETKAARLARYAELRWSLDTSPSFQG